MLCTSQALQGRLTIKLSCSDLLDNQAPLGDESSHSQLDNFQSLC
jgi:hypothetical protein